MQKETSSKKQNKRNLELSRQRRRTGDLSSSDSSDSEYSEDDNGNIDPHEYRKLLAEMWPSKFINNKVKAGERFKKSFSRATRDSGQDKEKQQSHKKIRSAKFPKHSNKRYEDDTECTESDSEYQEPRRRSARLCANKSKRNKLCETDEDDDDSAIEVVKAKSKAKSKADDTINIMLTMKPKNDEYYGEDDDEELWETTSEADSETENEDSEVSSASSSEEEYSDSEEDCDYDTAEEEDEDDEEEEDIVIAQKHKKTSSSRQLTNDAPKNKMDIADKNNKMMDLLKELQSKHDAPILNECIELCEEKHKKAQHKHDKTVLKQQAKNTRIMRHIMRDKNALNDFEFYSKIEVPLQIKMIKELREINKIIRIEKPYRLAILDADIPVIFKAAAIKKINALRTIEPGSTEYYKIKNWVDTFMRIPFGQYKNLPVNISDGVEICHEFIANAQKTLDAAVYGLNDAKLQIMQMLGQLVTNPKALGTTIAIHGPPGTGKTSLVKEGISKILNRPFAFIALGGATDSSFLEGHSYTYEGSLWGKIVQIIIDSKCMNPVIYFDELDKISDTPKGEEIIGILTHLTDTTQNDKFHDKYFSEVDFDLSKCLFIFSYNDENKVNPILKDRMYRIETKGYSVKQKSVIVKDYLLPKIRQEVKFTEDEIIIPSETIVYLIDHFCNREDGVRTLKRCLEIIYTKANLYRLMKPGANLFEEDIKIDIKFPLTITNSIADKLVKKGNTINPSIAYLYT